MSSPTFSLCLFRSMHSSIKSLLDCGFHGQYVPIVKSSSIKPNHRGESVDVRHIDGVT